MVKLMSHVSEILKKTISFQGGNNISLKELQANPLGKLPEYKPTGGKVTLSQLDTSHPVVAQAVAIAHNWLRRKESGAAHASIVLVATQVQENGRPSLTMTGYGCGKTHIAKSIYWASCRMIDGEPVAPLGVFYMANDLILSLSEKENDGMFQLCSTTSEYDSTTGEMVEVHPHVLVIDDVGTEKQIPYITADNQQRERQLRYFEAINYCYERGISVVITGNMRLHDMESHIGGRAWSRLMEMAPAGFMLDMTNVPDWRRKNSGR